MHPDASGWVSWGIAGLSLLVAAAFLWALFHLHRAGQLGRRGLIVGCVAVPAAGRGSEPHQLNTWVAHPPFVWLGAVMVVAALVGHVVLTRRLLGGPGVSVTRAASASR